ncbi:unnamed protein product [Thlaspi arvense]|uniref:Uncharacterized protein n=1 Tax=Thlaspi arvense TaxID=13288 RepID=A0AAU9RB05_THLAR|nr:unnamed protein product [Thlaspi arvense]
MTSARNARNMTQPRDTKTTTTTVVSCSGVGVGRLVASMEAIVFDV